MNTSPAPDFPALATLYARAFQNDPLWRWIEPDDARRARVSPVTYGGVLRYCQRYGELRIAADHQAASGWLLRGHLYPTLWRQILVGMAMVPFSLGPKAFLRLEAFDALAARLRRRHAPTVHRYLWAIACDPEHQGKGLVRSLVQPVLDAADAGQETLYLETQNPNNLPIYQRFGFRLLETVTLGDGAVTVHAMRRAPRSP